LKSGLGPPISRNDSESIHEAGRRTIRIGHAHIPGLGAERGIRSHIDSSSHGCVVEYLNSSDFRGYSLAAFKTKNSTVNKASAGDRHLHRCTGVRADGLYLEYRDLRRGRDHRG
jgi:hypothetical protein